MDDFSLGETESRFVAAFMSRKKLPRVYFYILWILVFVRLRSLLPLDCFGQRFIFRRG